MAEEYVFAAAAFRGVLFFASELDADVVERHQLIRVDQPILPAFGTAKVDGDGARVSFEYSDELRDLRKKLSGSLPPEVNKRLSSLRWDELRDLLLPLPKRKARRNLAEELGLDLTFLYARPVSPLMRSTSLGMRGPYESPTEFTTMSFRDPSPAPAWSGTAALLDPQGDVRGSLSCKVLGLCFGTPSGQPAVYDLLLTDSRGFRTVTGLDGLSAGESGIPWSPERHWMYTRSFKEAVRTLLLCQHRDGSSAARLPKTLFQDIISLIADK